MGLPGDSLEYFKKTVDYALELKPLSVQVKQLYLNPDTLFYNERRKYGIQLKEDPHLDFRMPPVFCKGLGPEYYSGANEYVKQKIKEFSDVKWKLISRDEYFLSEGLS